MRKADSLRLFLSSIGGKRERERQLFPHRLVPWRRRLELAQLSSDAKSARRGERGRGSMGVSYFLTEERATARPFCWPSREGREG